MAYQFDPTVEQALAAAASRYGLPVEYLRGVAKLESGGNPNAQNPSSSAGGLMQFTDGTAKAYGLTNKLDPYQSADAGARLMRDNMQGLQQTLGRTPTMGELYLAHQQGLGGARKLLSNPSAPATAVVGQKAVALNGGNPNMTAGDFAGLWVNKANGVAGAPAQMVPTAAGMAGQQGIASLPAVAATPAAAPADPMAGVFGLLMQARMAQPAPVVGAAPMPRKQVDTRSDDEKLASVSQTPDVYLERLKRKNANV